MISSLILILKVLGISWFIRRFDPFIWIIDEIPKKNVIVNTITSLLECLKCLCFWIGLIMGGIWIGLICAYLGFWYDHLMSRTEIRIKFKKLYGENK